MADVAEKTERKIVVAVDEGDESLNSLTWCLKNVVSACPNYKDTLVLLFAKPPRVVYTALDGTDDDAGYLFSSDIIATMEKYSSDVAETVIEKAKRACENVDIKVEVMVEKGDPRDVILEAVEKLKADLLVMGSHGYGLIKRTFLGSVSNHCAQNAKCPVLIVKNLK
ncbi:hypothetical protein QJS04_geneDACA007110 [Acorus gramineus]|uniref:UspA domain-containing protein n=1 Tax=Acorus gramineus TaxID=55184 RepID=A0AAV9BQY0_ACOGR|nr:hypothetical protein QJS04_geneDACA007110 [Acorus gramineus]